MAEATGDVFQRTVLLTTCAQNHNFHQVTLDGARFTPEPINLPFLRFCLGDARTDSFVEYNNSCLNYNLAAPPGNRDPPTHLSGMDERSQGKAVEF